VLADGMGLMLSADPDLSLEKNDDLARRMGERIAAAARLCRLQVGPKRG
jgi:hypothetical protein